VLRRQKERQRRRLAESDSKTAQGKEDTKCMGGSGGSEMWCVVAVQVAGVNYFGHAFTVHTPSDLPLLHPRLKRGRTALTCSGLLSALLA
jgi:hypothetical protein